MSKSLHWLTAGLLFCQFAIAWTMPHMGREATTPDRMISLHFSFGILILAVVVVRLAWRGGHRPPPYRDSVPAWELGLAHATHWTLYLLLIVSPILGWINASWRGYSVSPFGLLALPPLVSVRAEGWRWTGDVHSLISNYVLLGLIGLHVAAALYHGVARGDGVLRRMFWARVKS